MSKILKSPSTISKKKKYPHDLSMLLKFSSSVGHLLPVYYDLAFPGDKYKLSTEMFTQITDIVSPAMMKLTEHVDWFFVPLQQISQLAGDLMYGINDIKTTLINPSNLSSSNVIPVLYLDLPDELDTEGLGNGLDYMELVPNVDLDEYLIPKVYNAARLSELLGFSNHLFNPSWITMSEISQAVNPMLLCAYHKIFFDRYRNTDRTANDPSYYNLDKFIESGMIDDDEVRKKLFEIHYRQFGRDFFQITYPKPLIDFGQVGMMPVSQGSLTDFNNWLHSAAQAYDSNQQTVISASSAVSTATLRGMFAVEKLMELTRRAAKHYDAQTLAHFGFDVPQGISGEVYRVGEESSVIQVNEVIAQAVGSASVNGKSLTSTIGERGGKAAGYSGSGKPIKFIAPCHGILMAVYSAVPEADYNSEGLDRINVYRSRYDFFNPALDNLGMQPLFNYQVAFVGNSELDSQIIGWQYRYQELKLKYNRCCGSFNSTYENWTVKRYSAFSLPSDFYINPQYLDSILLLSFQPADEDNYSFKNIFVRDPLLHWFKFNVYKSSEMSTYSLPQL